jgi:antitoxin MazE
VELSAENGTLVIRPAKKPRSGWDDAFRAMAARGDDEPLGDMAPRLSSWDEVGWERR